MLGQVSWDERCAASCRVAVHVVMSPVFPRISKIHVALYANKRILDLGAVCVAYSAGWGYLTLLWMI